ncbi:MAG: hypothetical protein AABY51_04810 [Deltaproteobacteria bacterium]
MLSYLLKPLALKAAPTAILLALITISGCAHKRPTGPDLALVRSPGETLRAEAVVDMDRTLSASGKARIYAQAPGSFRIEIKGPFAQVVALFASDGYTLHTFTDGVERFYPAGSPDAPLPFSNAEIVSLLMGLDLKPLKDAGFEIEADQKGRPVKAEKQISGSNAGTVTVLFSDYRETGGRDVPFEISIQGPRLDRIRIRYSSVETGGGFEEGFFDIEAGGQD